MVIFFLILLRQLLLMKYILRKMSVFLGCILIKSLDTHLSLIRNEKTASTLSLEMSENSSSYKIKAPKSWVMY